jgi:amylosucrase
VILLGEVVMAPQYLAPYFGTVEKPECHLLYNATTMATTWHTLATGDTRLLRMQLDTVNALPKEQIFLNYLRCHDDIGWGLDYPVLRGWGMEEVPHKKYLNDFFRGFTGDAARGELYNEDPVTGDARLCGTTASLCGLEGGDQETAIRKIEMLHGMMLFQSGIPVLYSGDEIGQTNDWDYKLDPNKVQDSRYLHRGRMPWHLTEGEDTREADIFRRLSRLEQLRKAHGAFSSQAESWTFHTGSDHVLGMARYVDGELLLGIFNFSEWEHTMAPLTRCSRDLVTGQLYRDSLTLPGWGYVWLNAHSGE